MAHDDLLRQHLVSLLRGGQAYETFDDVVAEFGERQQGAIPDGAEHSAWQIVDHMLRSLLDIIEFSDNGAGNYRQKDWPAEYWSHGTPGDWGDTLRNYLDARARMELLINDKNRDLFQPFPWGDGQTLLREAMLAADHQSYHIGELIELKRWLDSQSI